MKRALIALVLAGVLGTGALFMGSAHAAYNGSTSCSTKSYYDSYGILHIYTICKVTPATYPTPTPTPGDPRVTFTTHHW